SAEAGRNSVAARWEHIEIGLAANGVPVSGVAATGAAALTGAGATGVGIFRGAGDFLTPLTTAFTLGMGTDLVIPLTGVGTHIGPGAFPFTHTRPTALILPTGMLTIAPYQEGDSFDT